MVFLIHPHFKIIKIDVSKDSQESLPLLQGYGMRWKPIDNYPPLVFLKAFERYHVTSSLYMYFSITKTLCEGEVLGTSKDRNF